MEWFVGLLIAPRSSQSTICLIAPLLVALRHFALAVLADHVAITIEPFRIQRSPRLHPHQRAVLITLSGFA
ncbi:hypothetical protein AAB983_08175, partial [Burkholderia contaminans]